MHRIALPTLIVLAGALAWACNGAEQPAGTQLSSLAPAVLQPGAAAATAVAAAPKPPSVFDAPQPVGTMATCPVMGGTFSIRADTQHSEYKGKHVYFCCPGCKPQFDAAPEKYLQ